MSNSLLIHGRKNVVAYLALFVALGGTSYAAINLPANSVGAKQIKKNAVRTGELKGGAVSSSDVKNSSLLAKDFKPGQLPAGAQGPRGPQGPAGSVSTFISQATLGTTEVFCEAGEVAVGGGGQAEGVGFLTESVPLPVGVVDVPATGWQVKARKADGMPAESTAWVVCAE